MALAFGPLSWTGWAPWVVQSSRPFLYLVWFLAGVGVGAQGIENGLLAPEGKLARRWLLWVVGALAAFGLANVVFIASLSVPAAATMWAGANAAAFVIS